MSSTAPDDTISMHSGLNGCRECRKSLRRAVDAERLAAARIYALAAVSGFSLPHGGSPVTHIRAALILARAKSFELTYLAETMALDLEAASDDIVSNDEVSVAQARQIAGVLLRRLQPRLTVQQRRPLFGRSQLLDGFDEVLQIRDAVAALAASLDDILARCPCAGPDQPSTQVS